MNKIYKLLLLPAFIGLSFSLSSQVETDVERDAKNTPNQNSIFNDLGKKKSDGSNYSADVEIKNNFGFCPTMLFRQKVFFVYERAVNDILILNFGLGKAFGNDVIQSLYFSGFSDYSGGDEYLQPGEIMDNSTYAGSGMLVHAGLKVFFDGEAFDGGFFELFYRHERLDYKLNPTVSGTRVENGYTAEFIMNAFFFGYGYKALTGNKNNFTHEYFMNFGIKNFNYTQFNQSTRNISGGNIENVYQRTSTMAKTKILPAINMGYIFGFGW